MKIEKGKEEGKGKRKRLMRKPRAFRPTNIISFVKVAQCQNQEKTWTQPKENKLFGFWKSNQTLAAAVESYLDIWKPTCVGPAWIAFLQKGFNTSPSQKFAAMSWQEHCLDCSSVLIREMKGGFSFRAEDLSLVNPMRRSATTAVGMWASCYPIELCSWTSAQVANVFCAPPVICPSMAGVNQ